MLTPEFSAQWLESIAQVSVIDFESDKAALSIEKIRRSTRKGAYNASLQKVLNAEQKQEEFELQAESSGAAAPDVIVML